MGTFGGTEIVPIIVQPLPIEAKAEYVVTFVTVTTAVWEFIPPGCHVKEYPADGEVTASVQVLPHWA